MRRSHGQSKRVAETSAQAGSLLQGENSGCVPATGADVISKVIMAMDEAETDEGPLETLDADNGNAIGLHSPAGASSGRGRKSGARKGGNKAPWSCSTCTLLNSAGSEECAACGVPKAQPLQSPAVEGGSELRSPYGQNDSEAGPSSAPVGPDWACPRCTFQNKHGAQECEMCAQGRTPEAPSSKQAQSEPQANGVAEQPGVEQEKEDVGAANNHDTADEKLAEAGAELWNSAPLSEAGVVPKVLPESAEEPPGPSFFEEQAGEIIRPSEEHIDNPSDSPIKILRQAPTSNRSLVKPRESWAEQRQNNGDKALFSQGKLSPGQSSQGNVCCSSRPPLPQSSTSNLGAFTSRSLEYPYSLHISLMLSSC